MSAALSIPMREVLAGLVAFPEGKFNARTLASLSARGMITWSESDQSWTLTDAGRAEHNEHAGPFRQIPSGATLAPCQTCGKDVTRLANGSAKRHTSPVTRRHCYGSGQPVAG